MVDRILALPEGTRLYILAPAVRGRKGEYRKEIAEWMKRGFQRLKIDGKYYEIGDAPALDKKFKHDIDVVVDRIVVRADIGQRLAESLETALHLAEGLAVAEFADAPAQLASPPPERGRSTAKRSGGGHAADDDPSPDRLGRSDPPFSREGKKEPSAEKKTAKIHDQSGPQRLTFSEKFACPVSGFTISEIEPRLFSFNNPFGACPECGGLGIEQQIDAELVIPDKEKTLRARRHRALGALDLALLHPDAGSARQALQIRAQQQVEGSAEKDAGRAALRLGRRARALHL